MEIHVTDYVDEPLNLVFSTLRDRLPELAAYISDVKEIVVEKREEIGDGKVRLYNRWYGKKEIPAVARSFLKPEHLTWLDVATWDEAPHQCHWELHPNFYKENVECRGVNHFHAESRGRTRIEITGLLRIDLSSTKAIPGFMRGRIERAVEQFIIALVTPNLKKVNRAVEACLRSGR